MSKITLYDADGLEELRHRYAIQPHRMKLFRNALFKHAKEWDEALATLPVELREEIERAVRFTCLDLVERYDSKLDGASKLVFRTDDGYLLESVILRPSTGRTSLCISSQVGCACHCVFCSTAKMGFARQLSMDEILDQVLQAARMVKNEGRSIRNVVFMGMGEPLLNLVNVSKALECLRNPAFFDYAGSRLMVSTVGIPRTMERFTQMHPDVRLALSLHSARQDVRQQLMPFSRNYTLEALRDAIISASGNGRIMIEYLMLEGINDGDGDLKSLIDFLSGIDVHINIIPFNEYDGCDFKGSPQSRREMFAGRLRNRGFDTTLRYSLGADIAAACGQLARPGQRRF